MGLILHRVVPLDVFDKVALHGEGELTKRAREKLRRAVILHAGVALLMLFEVTGCSEDFAAAVAAARFCVCMYHLLMSFQEARLIKGRPTLATLVLSQSALVCLEIFWVSVCSFTAITAEPFVFRQLSIFGSRGLWLSGAPLSLSGAG